MADGSHNGKITKVPITMALIDKFVSHFQNNHVVAIGIDH